MCAASARRFIQGLAVALIGISVLASCATPPVQVVRTKEERIRFDNTVGRQLAQNFEQKINVRQDIEVTVFLRSIAEKLIATSPELSDSPIGVVLIGDTDDLWANYALPGNRVYLSVELLRGLEYENEVASLLAFELAHIAHRHLMTRFERVTNVGNSFPAFQPVTADSVEFFGSSGLFAFSLDARKEAVDTAVGMIYRAGYDPRGLATVWKLYKNNFSHSPFDAMTLERLQDQSHQAIAMYAPLRNPVVRSEMFSKIRKRIQQL
jgi:predicted Zn-dependent protease